MREREREREIFVCSDLICPDIFVQSSRLHFTIASSVSSEFNILKQLMKPKPAFLLFLFSSKFDLPFVLPLEREREGEKEIFERNGNEQLTGVGLNCRR